MDDLDADPVAEVSEMAENDGALIQLIRDTNKQASQERTAQTQAWQASLDRLTEANSKANEGLRKDFRIFNILMLLGILALGGLNIAVSNGMLTFTHADTNNVNKGATTDEKYNPDHGTSFSSP